MSNQNEISQSITNIYSLTPLQEGMLFHGRLNSDSSSYVIQGVYSLQGLLDINHLKETLEILTVKYDMLRTSIIYNKVSKPRQVVLKEKETDLKVIDLSGESNQKQVEQINRIIQEDLQQGFDFENDPLMRMKIIILPNGTHKILWSFHHIIVDGWSMGILFGELKAIYDQLENGATKEELLKRILRRKKRSADFSEYINWLEKQDFSKGLNYWRDLLADYEVPTEIKCMNPPNVTTNETVKRMRLVVEKTCSQQLELLAKEANITMNTVLESAWGFLLSKYNYSEDVVFGKVVSGRNAQIVNIDEIVGLFINTIPARIKFEKGMTVKQLLQKVNEQAIDSSEFDYCSLAEVQNESRLNNELIKTLFVFENYFVDKKKLDQGLALEQEQAREETNYPITMSTSFDGLNISCEILYNPNQYPSKEISLILDRMEQVLSEFQKGFDLLLSEISFTPLREIEQIINEFNNTSQSFPKEIGISSLFEEQVDKYPNKTAVSYVADERVTTITYQELDKKANIVADQLRRIGVKKDCPVTIFAEKSIELIIGMLGILKADGAYVPMDMSYPLERIEFILNDCQPVAAVTCRTTSTFSQILEKNEIPVVDIAEISFYDQQIERHTSKITGNNLAYIMYTSGTTGQPKGTLIEQHSVARLVKNTNYCELTHQTVMLQMGAISFDASTFEVWGALLNGGQLVLAEKEAILSPESLKKILVEHSINTMFVTSALFNHMIQIDQSLFSSVKNVLVGGARLSEDYINQLLLEPKNQGVRLINGYGPTESTTFSNCFTFPPGKKVKQVYIGKPIANTTSYICNGDQICGSGILGELYIGGEGLARGYLNNSKLTEEKFIIHPITKTRLYRTGDLARMNLDGVVEYVGRIDDQVKIRGFRIEPAEIEVSLRKISGIKEAVVVVKEDTNGEQALFAYYVSNKILTPFEVQKALKNAIPAYMIPSYLQQIETIPLTVNGKVDREKLPDIAFVRTKSYRVPTNRMEKELLRIFREILDNQAVGIEDNFFEMGGHSLRATRLVNQIESFVQTKVRLKDIFDYPTVLDLAKVLENQINKKIENIPHAPEQTSYPMSPAQKRIFILAEIDENLIVYNMPQILKLTGTIAYDKLESIFIEMMSTHEILRTSFCTVDGEAVQIIADEGVHDFEIVENYDGREEDIVKIFVQPFDLTRGNTVRMRILKQTDGCILFLDTHHIVSDGLSILLYLEEFLKRYNGDEQIGAPRQYKDYCLWMTQRNIEKQQEFWLEQYEKEYSTADIPTDYPRKQEQQFDGSVVFANYSEELHEQVSQFTKKNKITEYMFFLSALMIMISKYSGEEDIVVGSPISGRTHADTESMLGMFVNTLAMRAHPTATKKSLSFIKEIKKFTLQAYENQEYPFEELISKVVSNRDTARNPLFDVMLAMQNNEEISLDIKNVQVKPIKNELTTSKFDMTWNIYEKEGNYQIAVEYCTALFKRTTIQRMITHLEVILTQLMQQPDAKIAEISMVEKAEKEFILSEFSVAKFDYPMDKTLIDLFEEKVLEYKDQPALYFKDKIVTYEELDQMANVLSNKLKLQGIGCEDRVAILVDRSIEMVVSLFAVLKAGAVYVPIDKNYPLERILYILEDSQAKCIISYHTANSTEISMKTNIPVIDLENKDSFIGNNEKPERKSVPQSLAYIIYTSGTTGKPKGVMVENNSIVHLMFWMQFKYPLTKEDVILQKTNYCFDVSTTEIFGWFLGGASLALLKPEMEKEVTEILDAVYQYKVSVMNFVPTMLSAYLAEIKKGDQRIESLRYVHAAGEALDKEIVKDFFKKSAKHTKLNNLYGPTEGTVYNSSHECQITDTTIPIGKPVGNNKLYVVADNQLCGIGVPGELWIGGNVLARGYQNNPELTYEKFMKNPFGLGRIYKTGDLVRWLANGEIEYFGRMDDQVKVRGFRIELEEISNSLRQLNSVLEVAVLTEKNSDGQNEIYAYFVAETNRSISEIKAELSKQIPDYMVPTYLIQVDNIPVTINGKLDKKALLTIEIPQNTEYTEPRNTKEKLIAEILSEVLTLQKIGIHENFFELGGDSIKAIRCVSKIRERGLELSTRDIIKNQTVAKIAAVAKLKKRSYSQEEVTGVVKNTPILKTFSNWKLTRPEHFNQSLIVEIATENTQYVQSALEKLMIHHDMLRSVYHENHLDVQSIDFSKKLKVQEYHLLDVESQGLFERIQEISTTVQASIDLENGPLIKAALFKTKMGDYLLLCIHHLIIDGVSWRILLEDFHQTLAALAIKQEADLPEKTTSYQEWAQVLQEYQRSEELVAEKEYWLALKNFSEQNQYRRKVSSKINHERVAYESITISFDEKITDDLVNRTSKAHHTTVNDLIICACGEAIAEWNGEAQNLIFLEGHGREAITESLAIDRTIGWFTTMYPVLLSCEGDLKRDLVETKEMIRRIPNHGFGYGLLDLEIEAEVYLNYLGELNEAKETFSTGKNSADENQLPGKLNLNGVIVDDKLSFQLIYEKNSFYKTKMETLADSLKRNLTKLIQYCSQKEYSEKTLSDYSASDLTKNELSKIVHKYPRLHDIYSLTALQEGMLFQDEIELGSTAHIVQTTYQLDDEIDPTIVSQAVQLLAVKHEALRSSFINVGGIPRQVITDRAIEFKAIVLDKIEAVERLAEEEVNKGFDLAKDSLLRVNFVDLKTEKFLIFTYHHIIMDGWCLSLLSNDFITFCNMLQMGKTFKELENNLKIEQKNAPKYSSYIQWLKQQEVQSGLNYWENVLESYEEPATILPMACPTPTENKMARQRLELGEVLTRKIEQFARNNQVTINIVMEMAFGILLQRYNQTDDVVFGKVVSGRNVEVSGIQNIVGLFANTIPIRVNSNNQTIKELLSNLKAQEIEADRYHYMSLADIQNKSSIGNELIKVLFAFENYHVWDKDELEADDSIKLIPVEGRESTNFALTLTSHVSESGLVSDVLYNPNQYITCEIKQILKRFKEIISGIVATPSVLVSELDDTLAQERNLIVSSFNAQDSEYPKNASIKELFEEQVDRYPHKIAARYVGHKKIEELTYQELDQAANILAHKLIHSGVKPEDPVAILMDKSLLSIIAMLGILKAGGAYVSIDTSYPKERIDFILNDCRPKVLLHCQASITQARFSLENLCIINLAELNENSKENVRPKTIVNGTNLAYLIYTSGTTGRPKGTMIEQRSVTRLVKQTNYMDFSAEQVILQMGSLSFDASTFEIWGALLNGGCLVLSDQEILVNLSMFKQLLQQQSITSLFITVALFNQLVQYDPSIFHTMKTVIVGGDRVSEAAINQVLSDKNNKQVKFVNGYGPTEATTFSLSYSIKEILKQGQSIPIGIPVSNSTAYVMRGDKLCGIGIPGELYLGGDGISRGYLNLPELTAEKFIENPFGPGKLYKSGDLAKWRLDGTIDYLGRKDNQIKIRGFRIEPAEIENTLYDLDYILDACVMVKEEVDGEKALCAYYKADNLVDPKVVKEELRQHLPSYMLPSYLTQVSEIPLNTNGKIDKPALLAIKETELTNEYRSPVTKIQQRLCHIFEQTLNIMDVGIEENFFEIGGHSLRAVKLSYEIERSLAVKVTLKEIFDYPTVKLLEQLINTKQREVYQKIPLADSKTNYKMSSSQLRIYTTTEIEKTTTAYNIPQTMKLTGNVNLKKLKSAYTQMIERHEIFRTAFKVIKDEPVQVILPKGIVDFKVLDDNGGSDEQQISELIQPFSLENGNTSRIRMIKKDDSYLMLLDLHHIVSDGMSMNHYMHELVALYNEDSQLPSVKQYKDYSEWMLNRDLKEQEDYWLDIFKDDVPVLELPLDFPRPQQKNFNGHMVSRRTSSNFLEKIKAFSNANDVTEYMVYLTGLMIMFAKYSRQEDLVVGSPTSGRTHKDTENMQGMFVNTLALRGKPTNDKSIATFLQEVKTTCLQAFEHQEYPFEELASKIYSQRDGSRNPVFDVMFVLQNNEVSKSDFKDIDAQRIILDSSVSKFDLTFNIFERDGRYEITVEYCTELFREATVEGMIDCLENILYQVVSDSEKKIQEVQTTNEKSKQLILTEFNNTKTNYPNDESIANLFEEQVLKHPDSIAIRSTDKNNIMKQVSYQQLNEMANKVASLLLEKDIQKEEPVPILSDKSIYMIAGILGILKAGGAYVPIDPAYPAIRRQYMLDELDARFILSDQLRTYSKGTVIFLDDLLFECHTIYKSNPKKRITADQLAYIMYTSGTTGKPKGTMIEQKSVVRLVKETNFLHFTSDLVVLQTGSVSFDAATLEIWGPLLNGGQLVLAETELIMDQQRLLEVITEYKINTMWVTSSLFNQLTAVNCSIFDSLSTLLIGGEKLSETHVSTFKSRNNGVCLINGYGPTEGTTFTTTYEIPEEFTHLPIGKPIANTQVYILDQEKTLCGIGVPGELCIGGEGVARGYWKQPKLTQQYFIPNPFVPGMLYCSGDFARWLPDGTIEYLGRRDEQVKIRGFRIELTEIEATIRKISDILDVAIIIKENELDEKAIYAYLVSEKEIDLAYFRKTLQKMLPDYMIPSYMMQLEHLPTTLNGKLDKTALPDIDFRLQESYEAPQGRIEETLANTFSEVLSLELVGRNDNFFEFGGDSIKAIRLVSKLRENGITLSVKEILKLQTVESLAEVVEEHSLTEINQENVSGKVTDTQVLKLFKKWNLKKAEHFNQAILLDGQNWTEETLFQAFEILKNQHDILRGVYREGTLEILPVEQAKSVEIVSLNVKGFKTNEVMEKMKQHSDTLQESFDLSTGPLIKVLHVVTDDSSILMITAHHLIIDGVSWRILIEDLETIYTQINDEKLLQLPHKTDSFIHWSEALAYYKQTPQCQKEKSYWEETIRQATDLLNSQNVFDKQDRESFSYESQSISLSQKETKQLLQSGKNVYRIQMNALLLSAVSQSIYQLSGVRSYTVLLESHGREEISGLPLVDRTIGWFTNLYPVVVHHKQELRESLIETKEQLNRIPNNGIGYGILGYTTEVEPELSVNYLGDMGVSRSNKWGKSLVGNLIADKNKLPTAINLTGAISDGKLSFSLLYDKACYRKEMMALFMDSFKKSLLAIVEQNERELVPVMTPSDFAAKDLTMAELNEILIDNSEVQEINNLTSLQEGMVFESVLHSGTQYVVQSVYEINQQINVVLLERAFSLLFQKHEVLRSKVYSKAGVRPKLLTLKNRQVEFNQFDFSKQVSPEYQFERLVSEDLNRGFKLEQDVLLRLTFVKFGQDRYRLILSFHHIIMDGWCLSIVLGDFMEYYNRLINGETFEHLLKELSDQRSKETRYTEYLAWLEEQSTEDGLNYFEELCGEYEKKSHLEPLVQPEVTDDVNTMDRVGITFDSALSVKLKKLAKDTHVTLNTLLEVAWGMTLWQYNGTTDVIFGKVVSGRNAELNKIDRTVGLFINTIPVRIKSDNQTIEELLITTQKQANESSSYDFISLAKIQQRTSQGMNLIQTLFAYENYYVNEEKLNSEDGLQLNLIKAREETGYDITVSMNADDKLIYADILFNPQRFDEADVLRMLEKMQLILTEFVNNSNGKAKDVLAISDSEILLITNEFNQTESFYDKEQTYNSLFERQVSQTSTRIAVKYLDKTLTYDELNNKANNLANYLVSKGIKQNDYVALAVDRGVEMFVAIIAILKIGAAYVPIDSSYPKERIRYILDDCEPKSVIVCLNNSQEQAVFKELVTNVIDLADEKVWAIKNHNFNSIVDPSGVCYVIYTSGTTGKPKGVMVENRGITALNAHLKRVYHPEPTDNVVQFANYIFDASVWEMTMAFLNGACLVIPPKESIADTRKFNQFLEDEAINIGLLPPQYCVQVNAEFFKVLTTGGTKATREVIDQAKERYINAYGPTENTVLATYWEHDCNSPIPQTIPIGRPIDNTKIYILNNNHICGIGMPGEICIAGPAVARGYLNRPELTKEKFINNPYEAGLMYRSGDLGRWLPNGMIEFLGRMDQQVKIRGFRIELNEVEVQLQKLPNIVDAVVIVKEDRRQEKLLSAYFTSKDQLSIEHLKTELRKQLPDYMIPTQMMQLKEIPLNRSGKVDQKLLPDIQPLTIEFAIPTNEAEEKLCNIFGELVEQSVVGIKDNFFDIGGHSLRATRLVNRIESDFSIQISLKEIFDNPTVAGIAELLQQKKPIIHERIPTTTNKPYYAMSSAQKRIYRLQQLDETGIAYNMPQRMKLVGNIDTESMKQAFITLLNRHEILRTSFIVIDGKEYQQVNDYVEPEFVVLDDLHEDGVESLEPLIQPFDLANGNVIRLYLIKIATGYLMYLDVHHIVFDGTSMGIYLTELVKVYNGQSLTTERLTYKDYSEWMDQRDLTDQKNYWENIFSDDVPVLELLTDFVRPKKQLFEGNVIQLTTNKELMLGIKELAKTTQTTEYMIWLSAIQILLAKHAQQEEVIVGSPFSGRTHPDMEKMLGMFINTLAMKGQPSPNKTYASFLEETKEYCLKAYENQEYPFEKLVETIVKERDMSRNPIFDVMFILQNLENATDEFTDFSIAHLDAPQTIAKMDLSFDVYETPENYKIRLEYSTNLFEQETVVRYGRQLIAILEQIIANQQQKINAITCSDKEEMQQILTEFNEPLKDLPVTKTAVTIFEEQVKLYANKTAVIYEQESLTYAELNQQMNTLAYELREKGIKPDDCVALITDRGIESIIGAYAIMKAGGAYVPIDPTFPEERIQFILEDCQIKAIVHHSELELNWVKSLWENVMFFDMNKVKERPEKFENLPQINQVTDLAYVIYTSGTTGKPKGVLVEHHGISNLREYFIKTLEVTSKDVVLQYANMIFDGSVWEMNMALLTGAVLIIASKEQKEDTILFEQLVQEKKVTVAALPTAFYANITTFSPRVLITAGSQSNRDLITKLDGNSRYVNSYGPSEGTVAATHWEYNKNEVLPMKIPIGKPLGNVQIYILNERTLCGVLVPGEICIGGLGVARGYQNNPELTKKMFVKNPFGPGFLYRTGDLGRWQLDGNIEFLGRMDNQVKIRGFRVELNEVEQSVRNCFDVEDVAVVTRQDPYGETELHAYYTSNRMISVQDIRLALQKELPGYMIPVKMMQIKQIPLNRSGKLDKSALPEIFITNDKIEVLPKNEVEQTMYEIFMDVLACQQLSTTDNFYEIGGDSIKAIRIVSKMREAGYELAVKDIMSAQTIERIAYTVNQNQSIKYIQDPVVGRVEKTPIMKEFDRWCLVKPDHFNQSVWLDVGQLTEIEIKEILLALVTHHDIFRATYNNKELVIHSPESNQWFSMKRFDYRQITMTEESVARECTEIQEAMNIVNGPLLRTGLFLTKTANYLMITIHHLAIDGISWRIFLEDFRTAMKQLSLEEDFCFPKKTASYQQWAHSLSEFKESYKLKNEKQYWQNVQSQINLGKVVEISYTNDSKGKVGVEIVIEKESTQHLLYKAHTAFNTEMNDLFLSALSLSFYQLTGQEKVAIGLEGHGREEIHEPISIDRTIGWFTTSYPVVLKCTDDLKESVIKTKEQLRKIPNHGFGYSLLNSPEIDQRPDVYFNYLGQIDVNDNNDFTFTTGENIAKENQLPGKIMFNGSLIDGQLNFTLIYDKSNYSAKMMNQLAELFKENIINLTNYLVQQGESVKTISDYGSVALEESEFDEIMDLFE